METQRVKTESSRFTQGGVRLLLCVVLAGCAAIVISLPIPVPPGEPPSLVVRRWEDRASSERLHTLAEQAPEGEAGSAVVRAFESAGRIEMGAVPRTDLELERVAQAALAARRELAARHGPQALAAVRARLVIEFERSLDERGPPATDSRDPRIGGFGSALVRWHALRDGVLVAPRLVLRTLYAARFNTIVGLPATSGFGRAERRAYFGWLALHALDVERSLRVAAASAYLDAGGGAVAEEALARQLYEDGANIPSAHAYERLYARTRSVRHRNHALAATAFVR